MWVMSEHAVRDQRTVAVMMGVSLTREQQLEKRALEKMEMYLAARGYGNETTIQAVAK